MNPTSKILTLLLTATPLISCSYRADLRPISPTDFAIAASTSPQPIDRSQSQQPPSIPSTQPTPSNPSEYIQLTIGSPDIAPNTQPDTAPSDNPTLVDAKVGDINGRPIIASIFLEKLAARLTAESDKLDRDPWRSFAGNIIHTELKLILENDLLEAEARATLPPEVEAGLINFVEKIRKNLISKEGGLRRKADDFAQQSQGVGLDEQADRILVQQLIDLIYSERIRGRVHVSWHDIELAYEQNQDLFNPPPRAIIRRISVLNSMPDGRKIIQDALDSGIPYDEVCDNIANRYSDDHGEYQVIFPSRDAKYTELEPFQIPELNKAIQALKPGESVGPIQTKRSTWWLKLEKIITPEHKSLYDVQADILRGLTERREKLEELRYMSELKHEASYTDLNDMTSRLVDIAEARYFQEKT